MNNMYKAKEICKNIHIWENASGWKEMKKA